MKVMMRWFNFDTCFYQVALKQIEKEQQEMERQMKEEMKHFEVGYIFPSINLSK